MTPYAFILHTWNIYRRRVILWQLGIVLALGGVTSGFIALSSFPSLPSPSSSLEPSELDGASRYFSDYALSNPAIVGGVVFCLFLFFLIAWVFGLAARGGIALGLAEELSQAPPRTFVRSLVSGFSVWWKTLTLFLLSSLATILVSFVFFRPVIYLSAIHAPAPLVWGLFGVAVSLAFLAFLFLSAMLRYVYYLSILDHHPFVRSLAYAYHFTFSTLRFSLLLALSTLIIRILGLFAELVVAVLLAALFLPIVYCEDILFGGSFLGDVLLGMFICSSAVFVVVWGFVIGVLETLWYVTFSALRKTLLNAIIAKLLARSSSSPS